MRYVIYTSSYTVVPDWMKVAPAGWRRRARRIGRGMSSTSLSWSGSNHSSGGSNISMGIAFGLFLFSRFWAPFRHDLCPKISLVQRIRSLEYALRSWGQLQILTPFELPFRRTADCQRPDMFFNSVINCNIWYHRHRHVERLTAARTTFVLLHVEINKYPNSVGVTYFLNVPLPPTFTTKCVSTRVPYMRRNSANEIDEFYNQGAINNSQEITASAYTWRWLFLQQRRATEHTLDKWVHLHMQKGYLVVRLLSPCHCVTRVYALVLQEARLLLQKVRIRGWFRQPQFLEIVDERSDVRDQNENAISVSVKILCSLWTWWEVRVSSTSGSRVVAERRPMSDPMNRVLHNATDMSLLHHLPSQADGLGQLYDLI